MPVVSIVVSSYNRPDYLSQALDSVFSQTYHDYELIVVDDCSTDPRVREVLTSVTSQHPRVFCFYHEQNQGPSTTRNNGLAIAKGTYVTFLDDDNLYEAHRLEVMVNRMEAGELDLLCTLALEIDGDGNSVGRTYPALGQYPARFNADQLIRQNFIDSGSVMIRLSALKDVGFFDPYLRRLEDWDLWIRLVLAGKKLKTLNVVTQKYRIHGKTRSEHQTGPKDREMRVANEIIWSAYSPTYNGTPPWPSVLTDEDEEHIMGMRKEKLRLQSLGSS